MHNPTLTDAVNALRPVFGQMLRIRKVRGIRLKNGEVRMGDSKHEFILYDDGVQSESDGSANLWTWSEIAEVLV